MTKNRLQKIVNALSVGSHHKLLLVTGALLVAGIVSPAAAQYGGRSYDRDSSSTRYGDRTSCRASEARRYRDSRKSRLYRQRPRHTYRDRRCRPVTPFYSSMRVIARVQAQLNCLGYCAGRADGIFSGQTARAISRFQRDHGLEITGTVTADVVRSLGI